MNDEGNEHTDKLVILCIKFVNIIRLFNFVYFSFQIKLCCFSASLLVLLLLIMYSTLPLKTNENQFAVARLANS